MVPLAINLGVCRRPDHADRELPGRRPTAHHEVKAPTIVRDRRHIVQRELDSGTRDTARARVHSQHAVHNTTIQVPAGYM